MQKNETLHSMLTHIGQNAARPEEIDLWPSIQARLAVGNDRSQPGEFTMQTNPVRKTTFRVAVIGALTILLTLGILLGLPQGRAWAQTLFRFFTNTSDQMLLPTQPAVQLAEMTPGAPRATATPTPTWHPAFYATCGDIPAPRCSIEKIQSMVRFPVKGISDLPAGMVFLGATGGPEGVYLSYWEKDPTVSLLLLQGPKQMGDKALPVGASAAIEPVQIGDVSGEYVKGIFVQYGGETVAHWDSNANTQWLSWEVQDLRYTLWMSGSPNFPQDQLGKDDLVRLAASLTDQVAQLPPQARKEAHKTFDQIVQEAGFAVIEPDWLPEGYQFDHAVYLPEQQRVCLLYHHPADVPMFHPSNAPAPSLSIAMSAVPLPDVTTLIADWLRPDQVLLEQTKLTIIGTQSEQGQYSYGSLKAGQLCETGSNQNEVLIFQAKGLNIAIIAQKEGPMGGEKNWLTRQEMAQVAESMTGVPLRTQSQPDPEHLTTLAETEQLAGFPLKQPTKLPEGRAELRMAFTYAQVKQDGSVTQVTIHYSDGEQEIFLRLTKGSTKTLESLTKDHPEAYQPVTIHGQPALLSQGFFADNRWKYLPNGGDGEANVTWFEDDILYTLGGFNAYPSQVWLDIAESIK